MRRLAWVAVGFTLVLTSIIVSITIRSLFEGKEVFPEVIASTSTSIIKTATSTNKTLSGVPYIGKCQIFPKSNPWNTDISRYPLNELSDTYIASMNKNASWTHLHPDFGFHMTYGMPVNIVTAKQKKVPIRFVAYGGQSDPGPYPIPSNAIVQSGTDHHLVVVDKENCILYEMYNAGRDNKGWYADSGAVFNLKSSKLRPDGWTSADAAGLPIYPGLVKYSEVKAGAINHAIRMTVNQSQYAYIHPATHSTGPKNSQLPPMGLRLRLKANYDISKFPYQARVILQAMKKYGVIIADNGTSWVFGGEKSPYWNDKELDTLKKVPGTAFEAVKSGAILYPRW